jgi:copper chaperone NosL
MAKSVVIAAFLLAAACGSRQIVPATLDTTADQCGSCRMVISDPRFASQVVAPYQEPRFFDDMGCLSAYLATAALPKHAVVYVADHRTKEWVRADAAVYTRVEHLAGAMGSHVVAHASEQSRQSDPGVSGGTPLSRSDVFPRLSLAGGVQ